jgi:hypothetical protein
MPKGIKGFQKGHKFFGDLSKPNYFQKGHKTWIKGKRHSKETIKKLSEIRKGNHYSPNTEFKKTGCKGWAILGGKNEYRNLHKQITKLLGKPTKCEHCGKDGLIGKQIHWASKSGEYKKDENDWIRLCVRCHFNKDKKLFLI